MTDKTKSGISRRTLLKGSAITAGFLGTTAVTGFPADHAALPVDRREPVARNRRHGEGGHRHQHRVCHRHHR
jgi:hypothetical protein